MDADTSKYLKLHINYELLDSHRQRDMVQINYLMDRILEVFSEEIIWDKLHVADKTTDMHQLQRLVKHVRGVTTISNQHANDLLNDE